MSTTDEARLPGELPLWEVPGWKARFGVVAGITGRGRPGEPPFDLGLWGRQPVGEAHARWRRFLASFSDFPSAVLAHQVHGHQVLWHPDAAPGWTLLEGADGHATATAGRMLLVTVADCVPVYLVAPAQRAVALLHAGWRGTAAGILARGVALLRERTGAAPGEIFGHAGVAISGPRYEVGREVMEGIGVPAAGPGPWHLDLREVLAAQAAGLGLAEFTRSGHCTSAEAADFFSHRGSGGGDGRMVAYLGLKADGPSAMGDSGLSS
ncbi:MAG: polyphenol oxidase family protein [Gemmatimonadota bacterium]